jgi:signal transduction histidine kinase
MDENVLKSWPDKMPRTSLAAQLLEAFDRERRRLARALHSTAAQQAAALQFNLAIVAQSELPPRAAKALSDSIQLAGECALEIRNISYSLHPPLLDEIGLAAALRACTDAAEIDADLPQSTGRLPEHMEIALFRIVEEALPHISRLGLKRGVKTLTLDFDLRAASPAIRERVKYLKGRIAAKSGALRITVPLGSTNAGSGSSRSKSPGRVAGRPRR